MAVETGTRQDGLGRDWVRVQGRSFDASAAIVAGADEAARAATNIRNAAQMQKTTLEASSSSRSPWQQRGRSEQLSGSHGSQALRAADGMGNRCYALQLDSLCTVVAPARLVAPTPRAVERGGSRNREGSGGMQLAQHPPAVCSLPQPGLFAPVDQCNRFASERFDSRTIHFSSSRPRRFTCVPVSVLPFRPGMTSLV